MITVEEAVSRVADIVENRWRRWVRGPGTWPLVIGLRPPSGDQLAQNLIDVQNWAGHWIAAEQAGTLPGQVIRIERRVTGLGLYSLPHKLIITDLNAALGTAPEIARRYQRAMTRHQQAIGAPSVRWTDLAQISTDTMTRIEALNDHDWGLALDVADYLASTPVAGRMIREISIDGVHTKWIEQHAALVLDMICPPSVELPEGTPITKLRHALGLRSKDRRINVALRCPELRAAVGGLSAFRASIRVLNASKIRPPALMIIENDELGYTITDDIRDLAIIHGLGAAAPMLAELNWCQTARIYYWGDIDRAGLLILATLRRAGVDATSILMDVDTLTRFNRYAHATDSQKTPTEIPHELTETEQALYQLLNAYHQGEGKDWQLEQEAIDPQHVLNVITAATGLSPVRAVPPDQRSMQTSVSVKHGHESETNSSEQPGQPLMATVRATSLRFYF